MPAIRTHALLGMIAATDAVFDRYDDDAHVLSDDDGIADLFDETGADYPCENPF